MKLQDETEHYSSHSSQIQRMKGCTYITLREQLEVNACYISQELFQKFLLGAFIENLLWKKHHRGLQVYKCFIFL